VKPLYRGKVLVCWLPFQLLPDCRSWVKWQSGASSRLIKQNDYYA